MVRTTILDNGIRILTEKMREAHSATLGLWVQAGSRHETRGNSGISHLIEHMLFKGTERRSALDIALEIDSVGGLLNAFTSREYTCYYAKVLGRKMPLAVDLLSDILLNSVFDLDELEKERQVILQEIYMIEDTPEELVHDLVSQSIWQGHPLGMPISGSRDTVMGLGREDVLAFMAEKYCGRNILITAAGDVDHDQLVDLFGRRLEGIPGGEPSRPDGAPRHRGGIEVHSKELEQVHICLGTKALAQGDPRRFELYLLNTILGSSMSSRLFQSIREEHGLAYSIYSYLNSHTDVGTFIIYAGTTSNHAQEVVALILKELRRLKDELLPEETLHAAKEQLKGNLLLSMEATDNRMTRLAKNEIYFGRSVSLKEVLDSYDRVTSEGVLELCRSHLIDRYLNLQIVGRAQADQFPAIDLTLD